MTEPYDTLLREVWHGRRQIVWRSGNGEWTALPPQQPVGLLSGSFNPLHAGHRELRTVAEQRLGGPVGYELAIVNADKPPLEIITVQQRAAQFEEAPLAVTAAATFVEKARLLSEITFVVGYDTAERILQPRFYNADETAMQNALDDIRANGCRFLVAGRVIGTQFCGVGDLVIPPRFRDLFLGLSESEFRSDLSSTEIRRQ